MSTPSGDNLPNPAVGDAGGRWFTAVADHLGEAYLRYSFTKGTTQEVTFLLQFLEPGRRQRVLDVGCGPGRHARALQAAGIDVVGVDLSERFCGLVRDGDPAVPAVVADVRALPLGEGFDLVISLCQGGFGLLGGPGAPIDADRVAVAEMARSLRPGGRIVLSAFSSYFQVCHQADLDEATFDVEAGVMHERTTIRSETGEEAETELWTTGFTPRELRLLAASVDLDVEAIYGVEPGDYAARPPDLDHPEFLLIARRPT